MKAGLTLSNVTIAIGTRHLAGPLSVHVRPGETLSLMGPSGSGKSSLIAHVSGVLDPAFTAGGSIMLDGAVLDGVPVERRRIGVLFQDDLLFAHMTVAENLAFAVPRAVNRHERWQRVQAALHEAELPGIAARRPETLSGGQRARVALMRALLAEPRALLLDEPFARLDMALRERIRAFTFATIASRGIPALLVTHDRKDVPGRLMEIGGEELV
ncbi:ATP-binding cassette domain-containing protein [Novosphingobium beihaiensis]|uniref:ATP-binding cassette domain-containing protein n=1 Tax=Novosphingobium beihaiensis TaxID=2930389 RepID=A0ABT0BLV3_9SPHN|nr:ATP-binding cassette domain-containing protein [Novosphingobium beihaiensis]MCJ2185806.1 ATP-binding cassette domain-containing protein [Novosphingobium beihaiensis]